MLPVVLETIQVEVSGGAKCRILLIILKFLPNKPLNPQLT
jgi:hypothetical protein